MSQTESAYMYASHGRNSHVDVSLMYPNWVMALHSGGSVPLRWLPLRSLRAEATLNSMQAVAMQPGSQIDLRASPSMAQWPLQISYKAVCLRRLPVGYLQGCRPTRMLTLCLRVQQQASSESGTARSRPSTLHGQCVCDPRSTWTAQHVEPVSSPARFTAPVS
jgi:hypothetical protein